MSHLPFPESTTGIVHIKILKSSANDQLSMYSKSSLTQSSKFGISFLPFTCHRHVMPGFTCSLSFCHSENCSYSLCKGGRGPTKLMSPLNTLQSCGISSRLYFLRNLPIGVTRGSHFILNTGPFI